MLKKVIPGPDELNINRLFSSPEHSKDRDNHCAPLLDVIELSENFKSQKLMVFPLLRPFNQPQIQTFREFADFFTQICEVGETKVSYSRVFLTLSTQGIKFMHHRKVAHR